MEIRIKGLTKKEKEALEILSGITGIDLSDEGIEFKAEKTEENVLRVSLKNGKGAIGFPHQAALNRGYGLICRYLKEGKTEFEIEEKINFDSVGPMFDVSQGNCAFTKDTLKKIIEMLALMGLNTLMLYCEDTFEVKEQPYFGYFRPKYTQKELKELDDFAYKFGIEMIPCCQTLAHLYDPMRWKVFDNIRDYYACLLVGKDETYKFIEDLIVAASKPFRTKKINICMDEAMYLGTGKYLTEFGYEDKTTIMRKHLKRVKEILDRHGLEPMMFSDMFYKCFTKKYWSPNATVPDEVIKTVPDNIDLILWNYSCEKIEEVEKMLIQHKRMSDKVTFFGGIWSWLGYSLGWSKTLATTEAALNACKKCGIRDVMLTTWGDHGTEAAQNVNLIGCQLYAEYAYGDKFDYEKFKKNFKAVTGGRVEDFEALELFDKNAYTESTGYTAYYNASKQLMWQDIMLGLIDGNLKGFYLREHYADLAKKMKKAKERNGQFNKAFDYYEKAAKVLEIKSEAGLRLCDAYKKGDKDTLALYAEKLLSELNKRVKALRASAFELWFSLYKPIGWEIMDMRFGSLTSRIDSAVAELKMYLDGRLERLEELEQKRLPFNGIEGPVRYCNDYAKIVSASRIDPTA